MHFLGTGGDFLTCSVHLIADAKLFAAAKINSAGEIERYALDLIQFRAVKMVLLVIRCCYVTIFNEAITSIGSGVAKHSILLIICTP